MSRRRRGRRIEKTRRHAHPASGSQAREVIREAQYVERLAYTRSQAAEALGISRSTFIQRVLPCVETVEMSWGAKLIPADELERLLAEGRRAAQKRPRSAPPGRPRTVPPAVVVRIRAARAAGRSLRQIADELNASGVPTAHGGAKWWPSTVRGLLLR